MTSERLEADQLMRNEGHTLRAIATALDISPTTIGRHSAPPTARSRTGPIRHDDRPLALLAFRSTRSVKPTSTEKTLIYGDTVTRHDGPQLETTHMPALTDEHKEAMAKGRRQAAVGKSYLAALETGANAARR